MTEQMLSITLEGEELQGQIPKKTMQGAYNKLRRNNGIITENLKQVLMQDFFFHSETREFYDFSKV